MKPLKVVTLSGKTKALWIESETDCFLTSDSDNDTTSSGSENSKTSPNVSKRNCCFICSILPALSTANCCGKHLALFSKTSPAQIISPMSSRERNWSAFESKRKHRCHSISKSRRWRKKRLNHLKSSNTTPMNDSLLSSNEETSTPTSNRSRNRSNHLLSPLNKKPYSPNRHRTFSSPFLPKQNRISSSTASTPKMADASTSTDDMPLESARNCSVCISLKRIIHVKDEDEEITIDSPRIVLNMAEATQQMAAESNPRPKILLKRVCLEQ